MLLPFCNFDKDHENITPDIRNIFRVVKDTVSFMFVRKMSFYNNKKMIHLFEV